MPRYKDAYLLSDLGKENFKIWLVKQKLSITKFARKCGVTRQYISLVLDGKTGVTHRVRETFKKGGYDLP